ncbi:hypothetical protein QUF72_17790 [Desulfobacterales bacterium HSG2]|nr:hypothetical protein [Desulfobacterales bacterium HSG2]
MSFRTELKPPHVIPGRIEKMGHFFNSDPESTDDIPSMSFQTELKKPRMSFNSDPESTDISGKARTSEHHSGKGRTCRIEHLFSPDQNSLMISASQPSVIPDRIEAPQKPHSKPG